jgi:hypothetical protein
MEGIFGGLAFASIMAAHVLAVVAVRSTKRDWHDVRKGRSPSPERVQSPVASHR